MDFIDELRQFSKRVETLKDKISTEEATKTSLIMPFFQLLGYDVFNPHEFLPEFTADVGIKKGEKVDYAIIMNDKPAILIEAKWCGDKLDKHDSQLFRYFGTTQAKFAILTNGIVYKFFTDLDEQNKMDSKPFLEFNILDIRESYVHELKKFHKDSFDIDTIFNTASELKYSNEIKNFMSQQLKQPSDTFVKYILGEVYSGVRTQSVIEKFRDIVKKSLNQFVNELMSDKITSALKTTNSEQPEPEVKTEAEPTNQSVEPDQPRIVTTVDELESYFIIKHMLSECVAREKITQRDTESYFGILYDNNTWKWICRLKLDTAKKYILIPKEDKSINKYFIDSLDDLYKYKNELVAVVKRYAKEKPGQG